MIGTWNGNYKFDNQKIQKVIGFEKTNFKIIIDKFDGINFEGTVTDDLETGGMYGEGEIKGKIKDSKITFIKQMPIESLIDVKTGKHYQTTKKHSPIYYSGTIINSNTIVGEWKFRYKLYLLFGILPFLFRPGKGKWEMTN